MVNKKKVSRGREKSVSNSFEVLYFNNITVKAIDIQSVCRAIWINTYLNEHYVKNVGLKIK